MLIARARAAQPTDLDAVASLLARRRPTVDARSTFGRERGSSATPRCRVQGRCKVRLLPPPPRATCLGIAEPQGNWQARGGRPSAGVGHSQSGSTLPRVSAFGFASPCGGRGALSYHGHDPMSSACEWGTTSTVKPPPREPPRGDRSQALPVPAARLDRAIARGGSRRPRSRSP